MKLIKTLHTWKIVTTSKLQNKVSQIIFPLSILSLFSILIWLGGPYLTSTHTEFLAQPEKRIYVILFLFLVWLLKFLLIDFDNAHSYQSKDERIHKKLLQLQNRFQGAINFLNTTSVTKQNKSISLNKLPWYLLIGPKNAGKTTLLANSDVHFILQKQFQNLRELNPSECCDWWITRDVSIIDVPGRFISMHDGINPPNQKFNPYFILWNFFLNLLNKKSRKKNIEGIIIALPASEIMKHNDTKHFHALLRDIFSRIQEVKKNFPKLASCQLIITKCDLLPGFNEFFSESSKEELTQSWGVTLPPVKSGKIAELFTARFNLLIKKINQQLIWRMHQERNPMLRPFIKDFPLQVERIKEFTLDFIKNFSAAHLNVSLQSINLTSAIQTKVETKKAIIDQPVNQTDRSVKIFKEPASNSQAYFIKQLISHGFTTHPKNSKTFKQRNWKYNVAYAASIILIIFTTIIFGKDFHLGLQKTYAAQELISEYQSRIALENDATERVFNTIALLNLLKQPEETSVSKFNLSSLLSFYSHKSQQKTQEAYNELLQTIFIKEIKNYFEDYLLLPINKKSDDIYAVLKAYLMMGDLTYFDPDYIYKTCLHILPKSISQKEINDLASHLQNALHLSWTALIVNDKVIQDTRKYLFSQPALKLSYIILKNLDKNNFNKIDFEKNLSASSVLVTKQFANHIPAMFTAKSFNPIVSQETILAAQETLMGNWVLGMDNGKELNPIVVASYTDQLRATYINNYIKAWENLLINTHLVKAKNLSEIDMMTIKLISDHSPLLQLLNTLHANTYFEPIISSSPKLQNLGLLIEKNSESQNLLYEIFSSLQSLHNYLQIIINSNNQKKAAFEAVSSRMLNSGAPDAITQLRIVAVKSPEPIKSWLANIADDSWKCLMQESGKYLDTSWKDKVYRNYQTDISNHYPFNTSSENEVAMQNFINFFGNPGTVINFYNNYLQRFVDTSTADWHWKKMDGKSLPFSEDTLRQIQQAMHIHYSFFPNNDDKPYIKFALQPYQFGKSIRAVRLNISDAQFSDENNSNEKIPHIIAWPSQKNQNVTSIQLIMNNQQIITRKYPGNWGWFKLINQSFESMLSKKAVLINLSFNQHPVKYIFASKGKYNPYLSLNLNRFHLPEQLVDERA